jgi:2,3-bisphosphoglycerate-independent phosphoglycerate mutase
VATIDLLKRIVTGGDTKIVFLVIDGLGGLPKDINGPTELEFASTPNLDTLAFEGMTGLSVPIGAGIAPGSGPGHMALFGYDPIQNEIGRGVLESLGIGFHLAPEDVAARGNFCTVDESMAIIDRRAGRIPTNQCKALVEKLREIDIKGVEIFVEPVQDYRFALIFRGDGLDPQLTETDPQVVGQKPLDVEAISQEAQRTAGIANDWIKAAREILKDQKPANMVTLRGWARKPQLRPFPEIYNLRSAAIAVYPMYKGLAGLVGMTVIPECFDLEDQLRVLEQNWKAYDFFFIHYKYTDSRGEDGDFEAKAKEIEKIDSAIPRILGLGPQVVVVTGDHSTPSVLRAHSWHAVPALIWAPGLTRRDESKAFGETQCLKGALGQFLAKELMTMVLSHAKRTVKFGA